jgi:hypothetical protein
MHPTFLAAPRLEGASVFLAGATFLPASVFLGVAGAFALVEAGAFAAFAVSDFFSEALLGAAAFGVVATFVFAAVFLTVVDLGGAALVVAAFAGRALTAALGAATLAGLFC